MTRARFPFTDSAEMKCEVCGNSVSHLQALKTGSLDYSVCSAFACNRVMDQQSSMTPAMFRSHLKFQRKVLQQHRQRQAELKRRIDELTQRQRKQEQTILDNFLSANAVLDRDSIQTIVIPSGKASMTPLPGSRIEAYLQHLKKMIDQAAEWKSAADITQDQHADAQQKLLGVELRFAGNPELRTISDRLCGLCKGGCCVAGGDHAYLSTFTMYQQLQKNPGWDTEQLLETYRSHVSENSMQNSCINHTRYGCALPRELRSDICNAFYCDTLKAYQRSSHQNSADRILVIQRSETYSSMIDPGKVNEISRAVFLDKDSTSSVHSESGQLSPCVD